MVVMLVAYTAALFRRRALHVAKPVGLPTFTNGLRAACAQAHHASEAPSAHTIYMHDARRLVGGL